MHVKFKNKLCSLLGHIPFYLIVYWWPRHVFHWLRDFPNNCLYFGFNFAEQEIIFCIFLSCRDRSDVKQTQSFRYIIFSRKQSTWEAEVNVKHHEGEKSTHHACPIPSCVVGLMDPFLAFLAILESSWPIYVPMGYFVMRRQRNREYMKQIGRLWG
jgi:hypothetical protein